LYKCLAKGEVAIIERAVILNPMQIERNVAIFPKASELSIFQ